MKRVLLCGLAFVAFGAQAKTPLADTLFRNAYVYTVDAKDSVAQALAVKDGRIVYVGDQVGAKAFTGRKTQVVDLKGRMVMPGLIDGHMHPQSGGLRMLNCNLDYASLTIAEFQARIQNASMTTKQPDRMTGWRSSTGLSRALNRRARS